MPEKDLPVCIRVAEFEIAQNVTRYASIPGQATSYMVGMQEILRLRQKSQEALGEEFDLKEFHNKILVQGELPLPLLNEVVEQWLREEAIKIEKSHHRGCTPTLGAKPIPRTVHIQGSPPNVSIPAPDRHKLRI